MPRLHQHFFLENKSNKEVLIYSIKFCIISKIELIL